MRAKANMLLAWTQISFGLMQWTRGSRKKVPDDIMSSIMESTGSQNGYCRSVRTYHWLPFVVTIVLIAAFVGVWCLTQSYILAGIVAGVPSAVLICMSIRPPTHRDRCPQCGQLYPINTPWPHPPAKRVTACPPPRN